MADTNFSPPAEVYFKPPTFKFTPKQREIDFAQFVASGGDIVDSMIKARIVTPEEALNFDRSDLWTMAARLMKSKAIQERIDYFRVLHEHSIATTADRLRQEGAAIAYLDPAAIMKDEVVKNPITGEEETYATYETDLRKLPRHVRAAIKEVYTDKDGVVRYKWHDKISAMKLIGELDNHFKEAHEAAAPKITVNLDTGAPPDSPVDNAIDITPEKPELPDFLQ